MKAVGAFRRDFAKAVDGYLSSVNKPKAPKVAAGVEAIDQLTAGGFPPGSVVVLLGQSGTGKSALLRNIAISASKCMHVLYVPIQDGTISNATRRLIAIEASVPTPLLDGEVDAQVRLAAIDAGDRLKEKLNLSVFVEDGTVMSPMLCEAVAEDFANDCDATESLEGYEGMVIIDSISMLVDGQDPRSVIRTMKSIVYGSNIVAVLAAAGTDADINDYADADMVLLSQAGKATSQRHDMKLSVLQDKSGLASGNTAVVSFKRETMRVVQ